MKNKFIILLFLLFTNYLAQDWSTAPEIWSEPILVDSVFNIPYHWLESPALTKNLDTLYFFDSRVYMSHKIGDEWTEPLKLTDNINGFTSMRGCSLSRDGKRLYFSAFGEGGYGGWDIWYSDWDANLSDWSPAKNMGPGINTASYDLYLFEQTPDTVYVVRNSNLFYHVFDHDSSKWILKDAYTYHPLGATEIHGISMPANNKKLYFDHRPSNHEQGLDLCVMYWDSTTNYWSNTLYYLNINTKTVAWHNTTKRGGEYYPWISSKGRTMFFSSNRNVSLDPDSNDDSANLFVSFMLVDENGDTVTTVKNEDKGKQIDFYLHQNYPNPFNPITKISYSLTKTSLVKLFIYDAIGKKVTNLSFGEKQPGRYEYIFNSQKYNMASGVYYYQLIVGSDYTVKKMILTK
ncbi:MAG: T9SS type A sorting domain-containing protein [bacterium]